MSTTTTRGPYAKTAALRERILEACIEAFGQTGFYGATMKDIARRAGISYTGLLHHFARKEDLLVAVLDLRAKRGEDFLNAAASPQPGVTPIESLEGMLGIIVNNELQPGLLELHCVVSGEATAPEHPAHAHYVEHYRSLRRFYTETFEALAKRGELRSSVEPEVLAIMAISMLNGIQAQWLFDRDSVSMERVFREFLSSFVPALAR